MNTENNNVAFIGKILTIIFSICSLFTITGTWLNSSLSYILKNTRDYGYSVFEISDFLRKFGKLLDLGDVSLFSVVLSTVAYISIGFFVVAIIFGLLGDGENSVAHAAAIFGILLAVLFYVFILVVNMQIQEAFPDTEYGILPTMRPLWLIIFSVLTSVFSKRYVVPTSRTTNSKANFCTNCGTQIPANASFCPGCGGTVVESKLTALAKEKEAKANIERTLKNGGWKCNNCDRVNPSYTGTCACGNSKYEN